MPAADDLGGLLGLTKAEAAQGRQRLGIVDDAGEDQTAGARVEPRRMFEQTRIMRLDPAQMRDDIGAELLEAGIAAEFGEAREFGCIERQALRLFVGDHLQTMFDAAEKFIGLRQFRNRLRAHPAVGVQFGEHVERARAAHARPAAAENELLRLDEEFDFANAAAAELDVMARHGHLLVAAEGVDLALHRVNVGDRAHSRNICAR